uniref:Uncharacterized protein TCIL3000_11_11270 n=1 Tax=Trypanosoma congolense (strain IL3000) TaxID=1068625 RepID=G0V1W7_TRYCI|nr:unnamed protein product [Trypanosoma congolense IL3000]
MEAMGEGRKPRVMSEEELQRSVERLSKQHVREVPLKPLHKHAPLSQEALERSIKHLYNDSMEHKQRRLHEIEQAANAEINKYHGSKPKVDSFAIEAMVGRLYTETILRKNENLRLLFQRSTSASRKRVKKLGKTEQGEFVTRLYNEGMEHNRQKHIALFEEHVLAREPKAVLRRPTDLQVACDKLTSGKSVCDD